MLKHLIASAGAVLLVGCSAAVPMGEAAAVAQRFSSASPADACGLLAPETLTRLERSSGKGCADAIAGLDLAGGEAVQRVEVAGESAQVRLAGQVVFLARFPQGWLVTAAGCQKPDPDPAEPYECEVEP